ncbi:PcfJ domain-containing protein [Streptomyces kronopolitis]|uniref:PcfJ domain-containing protein n=1 Tax=Streptomyces kronopolitis TaxID=1612435 RepID=UPI003D9699CE
MPEDPAVGALRSSGGVLLSQQQIGKADLGCLSEKSTPHTSREATMSGNRERVLLHVKYLNDQIQPTLEGAHTGASLRVVARTASDGRVTVSGSASYRVHQMRASGKIFRHWQTMQAFSLLRTKADLVVLRVLEKKPSRRNSTQHLFAGGEQQFQQLLHKLGEQTLLSPIRHQRVMYGTTEQDIRFVEGPAFESHNLDEIQAQMTTILRDLQSEILRLVGDLPVADERFPLLKEISFQALSHSGQMHFLDATDYRAVAMNAFSKTQYRKPLAREVQRLAECMLASRERRVSRDLSVLNWFRLFRGLVPIDWIIESMRRTRTNHYVILGPSELVQARALFRRVPQPILGRILSEPVAQNLRIIKDTVRVLGSAHVQLRDLDLLPKLIKARGQRRIRGARDLETLVRAMPERRVEKRWVTRSNQAVNTMLEEARELSAMHSYNEQIGRLADRGLTAATWELWKDPEFRQDAEEFLVEHRRELMTAEQREYEAQAERRRQERISREKKRAAWAAGVTAKLDGLRVDGFRLGVAKDPDTLARWGSQLNNCIAGYADELGLDVFVGVLDTEGHVRLNIEINHEVGICQFLGTNNRDAVKELTQDAAQRVLDAITEHSIAVYEYAIGLQQLALPEQKTVTV